MKKLTQILFLVLSSIFFSESVAQIAIDGVFNETAYSLLASRLNINSGFAPDCEFTAYIIQERMKISTLVLNVVFRMYRIYIIPNQMDLEYF